MVVLVVSLFLSLIHAFYFIIMKRKKNKARKQTTNKEH